MNLKGKDLDDFFRQKLTNGDIPFEEANWARLEKRLRKNRSRQRIAWITLSGIAAMMLLTLTVSDIFLSGEKAEPIAANVKESRQDIASDSPSVVVEAPKAGKSVSEEKKQVLNSATVQRSSLKPVFSSSEPAVSGAVSASDPLFAKAEINNNNRDIEQIPVVGSPGQTADSVKHEITQPETSVNSLANAAVFTDSTGTAVNKPLNPASAFSVAFVAGPDINGVNNLKSNRGGIAVGLMLSYKVSKSFSVSTGALYAKKLYNSEFAYYKPNSSYTFPNVPTAVNAECRVLDIPLNINYTAWSKDKNALAVSAGVSSYIMLNEGYSFTYETPSTRGPKSYYITGRNKHYLGILNVSAAYERKISDEVSIGIQPYMKIPVTDIGYGNVKLLSTGVLTSVKLNIPSKGK